MFFSWGSVDSFDNHCPLFHSITFHGLIIFMFSVCTTLLSFGVAKRQLWWREHGTEGIRRSRFRLKIVALPLWAGRASTALIPNSLICQMSFEDQRRYIQFVNFINSSVLHKYYLPCYHMFGFKEAGKTIRFDTTINRSWVVKTRVSCCWSGWKKPCCWYAFNLGLQSSNCDWGDCQGILLSV